MSTPEDRTSFYSVDVAFFPHTPGETTAVMAALPLPWKLSKQDREWHHIQARVPQFDVTIFAKAADVSTQTGVTEVPVWEMRPEITALLEGNGGATGGETA